MLDLHVEVERALGAVWLMTALIRTLVFPSNFLSRPSYMFLPLRSSFLLGVGPFDLFCQVRPLLDHVLQLFEKNLILAVNSPVLVFPILL